MPQHLDHYHGHKHQAGFHHHTRHFHSDEQVKSVENILKPLELTDDDYRKVVDLMQEKMEEGLARSTNDKATIKMFPTYVRAVPNGTESGEFLALDLGGTNFRVLLVSLQGQEVKMESKIFLIPQHIMLGTGVQLFDHIADCIYKFIKEHNVKAQLLPLGFTFSFPCRQNGLASATLTTWTKGFKCEGVEGNDIVKLLHDAIKRRGDLDVKCLAVINDTVGALMSCAHSDRQCAIGLILGTGSNACYIEKLERVEMAEGNEPGPPEMLINTEWGAFGDDGCLDFITTDFDRQVDKHSINAGKQRYEKFVSGMYMGEIARLALEKLRKSGLLFGGEGSYHMATRGRFYTKYVSEIEGDDIDSFKTTKQIFQELEIEKVTEQDCRLVRHTCSLVSRRAAFLASAGLACLLRMMGRPEVTIGVDGSLYRFHPFFHDLMMEKIRTLAPGIRFKLMLSHDGSGKGAALVAAVASRILKEKEENSEKTRDHAKSNPH
ncbi:hexokinase-1-like isoform X2 [Pomacea canaliculata]|uniref:hexokinase-1-like isoform X2 n=1 Tax=Pomacea canaliculata TaxID=400727 RepID=UPI000D728B21|nr:hexokinase-1-like isoform X2 [Pomacea canaliculata]